MQDLIKKISTQTGLSDAQVLQVIEAVSVHVKEQYPLLATTVDSILRIELKHEH